MRICLVILLFLYFFENFFVIGVGVEDFIGLKFCVVFCYDFFFFIIIEKKIK